MQPFPSALEEDIESLVASGDALAHELRYEEALSRYKEAWSLIPEPKDEWEASRRVLAAIGDTHFLTGAFETAVEALSEALLCPGGLGDGFIHLRIGQCEFELGDLDFAAEHLIQAYEREGDDIFQDEDPKYIEFVLKRTKALLPEQW